MKLFFIICLFFIPLLIFQCSGNSQDITTVFDDGGDPGTGGSGGDTLGGGGGGGGGGGSNKPPFILTDRTGKQWDVTHAVQVYGFNLNLFQFGLGPHAIEPILNPQFLAPGDAGYPKSNETFLVIGLDLFGQIRAYPIYQLTGVEVVDEKLGEKHVAVAY